MSIEAQPLDLTDSQAEFLLEFHYAAEREVRSSTALAIVTAIARDTMLRGDARITHRELQRRTGTCRRTVDSAIKTLKARGLIERTGTTDTGAAIYRANLDAGRAAHGLV